MSKVAHKGANIIEAMSRKDFCQRFVRGVCKARSFAALFSFGAENISLEEKFEVCSLLADNGIPFDMTELDNDLNEIAAVVSARAVSLQ